MNGHAVWRIRVARGERTCCGCGETFVEGGFCPRCALDEKGGHRAALPPSVATLSYLMEGEWEPV